MAKTERLGNSWFVRLLPLCLLSAGALSCQKGRYLKEIQGPLPPPPAIVSANDPAIEALLTHVAGQAAASHVLSGIHELIQLTVDQRVTFAVAIEQGKATVSHELAGHGAPTLFVSLAHEDLEYLEADLTDGKLSESEVLNVASVLFVPCLRRIHAMFYFTEPGDKSALKVDNHMQFRLRTPPGFTRHGRPLDVAVTVLNVDGVFFYLDGLVGDPDVRYELGAADAMALYRTLVYEAEAARHDLSALRSLGERVDKTLTSAITYQRSWH